jgi:ElaB/YqjD/DUF883 family membrane-anchored ribosome-binding protein
MAEERSTREETFSTEEPGGPTHGHGEGEASEASRRYAEEASKAARETAREAQATVQEYGQQLRHQGYDTVRQQQDELAAWLQRIGDAFGQTAEQLRQSNDRAVAACMDSTGDRARDAASYLRAREPREVMDDATHFARQHPGWVIGAAMVTGFVVSRFLKAAWTAPPESESESESMASHPSGQEETSRPSATGTARTRPRCARRLDAQAGLTG